MCTKRRLSTDPKEARARKRLRSAESQLENEDIVHLPASSSLDSTSTRKPAVITATRPASAALANLLRDFLTCDNDHAAAQELLNNRSHSYAAFLHVKTTTNAEISRGRARGTPDLVRESQAEQLDFGNSLQQRFVRIQAAEQVVQDAHLQRRRALDALYAVGQAEMDFSPDGNQSMELPQTFWAEFRKAVDAEMALREHSSVKERLRRELGVARELLNLRYSEQREQLERCEQELRHARFMKRHHESNQLQREAKLVRFLKPVLESNEASPQEQLEAARQEVVDVAESFSKLKDEYQSGLWRYLRENGGRGQVSYDHSYCQARAKAAENLQAAEGRLCELKDRLRSAGELQLEDITSDFGTLSRDGRTGTDGPALQRVIRRRAVLSHDRVARYCSDVFQAGRLRDVEDPASVPSEVWEARSLGLSSAPSHREFEPKQRKLIAEWRAKMEELRETERFGESSVGDFDRQADGGGKGEV